MKTDLMKLKELVIKINCFIFPFWTTLCSVSNIFLVLSYLLSNHLFTVLFITFWQPPPQKICSWKFTGKWSRNDFVGIKNCYRSKRQRVREIARISAASNPPMKGEEYLCSILAGTVMDLKRLRHLTWRKRRKFEPERRTRAGLVTSFTKRELYYKKSASYQC